MLVASEPKRGLAEQKVKLALEMDSASDYFFGIFSSGSDYSSSKYVAVVAAIGIAVVAVVYFIK